MKEIPEVTFFPGLSVQIVAWGHTLSDIELAIDVANTLILDGFTEGDDKSETGGYTFDVLGEEFEVKDGK